ncbi:MAG: hypothetical protein QOI38_96 [Sphingomonadales bacterium]|jgi:hypothetical protein|nr:hypothetical protein [Sphingomonadales bacterium]
MPEIVAAIDEKGADKALALAVAAVGPQSANGSRTLGPFTANYSVTATFQASGIDLRPPDTIRIMKLRMNWSLHFNLAIDLNKILPQFCLPQICVKIFGKKICTPKVCISWPTISIPINFADFLQVTADFRLDVQLVGNMWQVSAKLLALPSLQFGVPSAAILAIIGAAAIPILLAVPFIGPFLAVAVAAILAAIGVAGLTGFLGPILTPFVSGLKIKVYERPRVVQLLPMQSAIDPVVDITIDRVEASIVFNQEDELIVGLDISR